MTQANTVSAGLPIPSLWTEFYVKYGDTLYNKYRVIYLTVVKENNELHDYRGAC